MILNILISILSVLFGLYTFKIFILRRKYAHIPGPPANGLIGFYFGNFYEVAKYRASGKIAPDLTVQWYKIYFVLNKYFLQAFSFIQKGLKNMAKLLNFKLEVHL